MKNYKNIFKPLTVKTMTLKNRVVMPPVGTNFAGSDGNFTEKHYSYYEQRAKGGTGYIILENVCIDYPMGTNGTTQLRMDNDQFIPGLYRFNELMHAYGTMTSVQINHAGGSAYALRLDGKQAMSASNIPSKVGNQIPRALTKEEIYHIIDKYGEAASRAQRAGFDSIEIHAGHSYLLSQFLSPLYNDREDEFGGSAENRARFCTLVVERVRKTVGPQFPICLRFSADELLEGGNSLEDTLAILDYFVDEVDILNVSSALNDSIQYQIDKMNLPDGWRSYMAKAAKEKYPDKVVITSGNIRDPKIAEEILATGAADLLAMGRGLIAEPNWVQKVKNGREDLLRKCISCNIGCADHRIAKSKPLRCTVNPEVYFEDAYKENSVKSDLKMVVIGGGTTGLEAATTAAEVGVNVELFEAKEYLGGLATEISRLPDKKRIFDFVTYLENRAATLDNLQIHLNHKVTLEEIERINPDIIVNATGAKPLLPEIEGLQEVLAKPERQVFTISDLLADISAFPVTDEQEIVIIGGGAVGLDVMEYYAERGAKSATIVEMQDGLGKDLDMITKQSMLAIAKEFDVNVYTETKLVSVQDNAFIVEHDGERIMLPFDKGFVCLGLRSDALLLPELTKYATAENKTLVNIGDSKAARRIFEGTQEAHSILATIQVVDREKTRGY